MIENFDEIERQLKRLGPTINAFKSEAVQLRIVELIFAGRASGTHEECEIADDDQVTQESTPSKPRKRAKRKATNTKTVSKTGKKAGGRPGPGAMIDTLIAEAFFKTGKGPADVVTHCRNNKVFTYTNTEVSVGLSRAVKAGKLKREKNKDGQFRYSNA